MANALKCALVLAFGLAGSPALAQAAAETMADRLAQSDTPPSPDQPGDAQPPPNVPPAGAPRAQEQLPEAPPEEILKDAPPVEKKQDAKPPEAKPVPPLPNTLPPVKKIEPKVPNA